MRIKIQMPVTLALMALSTSALAHPGHDALDHGASAFSVGFLHPFNGMDHLLAMLAIGIWAAQTGGRAIWQVPAAFLAMLCLGGILGMNGIALPNVELGVASSLVIFGALIASAKKLSVNAGTLVAGVFALFHGAAHGMEIPTMASGLGYSVGFIAASLALHVSGLFAVHTTRLAPQAVRYIGAVIAGVGMALLGSI